MHSSVTKPIPYRLCKQPLYIAWLAHQAVRGFNLHDNKLDSARQADVL